MSARKHSTVHEGPLGTPRGPRIRFLGAADTVTGSRYLVETAGARLLVDCGLFQGYKKLRERNWADPPFDPASLDAVLLTHAHVDHSGYLPRLRKLGFRGPVHCTHGTRDLLQILLPDSGHLQEEDAKRANRYGYTRHRPAEPLYTEAEAERCLQQLEPRGFDERFEPVEGVSAMFTRAGHIIGSACLVLELGARSVAFSGDVGRPSDPLMRPPAPIASTDYLVVESTYGDRRHPAGDAATVLARVVNETAERGGVMLVPSFAVGRAQHLLLLLSRLRAEHRIPELPIYLDSPMSIDATEIFRAHEDEHRISRAECDAMCRVAQYSRTPDESKAIDARRGPMIVLSASGMATGGRILHHLRRFLPGAENTVLLVGYQSAGTRGRALLEGADEIKLFGEYVPVKARVAALEGLSAHADHAELLQWLAEAKTSPRRVFVTHGEPAAADAFRRRLRDAFGWNAVVPDDGSTWDLE